jgi:iron complex transport system substrate-binding protein
MKTKNKVFASLEIAIVLCSVFLVTLPSIAAEQTAQTITASSEDDFVLGIYGNANEDDTIDMRDLTYVKLIFFGKKPETELADAKYDGKIDPLDFIQIKLIIVGQEKELTIVEAGQKLGTDEDAADRIVTVKKPVERIVCINIGAALEVLRALNAKDTVVGVGSSGYVIREVFFPELSKLPTVGGYFTPDYEAVLALNPDLLIMRSLSSLPLDKQDIFVEAGIAIAGLTFVTYGKDDPKERIENVLKLGYILDKEEEAKEFIDFMQDSEAEIYEKVTKLVPEEENRPKVYIEGERAGGYMICGLNCPMARLCRLAGGRSIGDELDLAPCPCGKVDPEWVIEQNPDVIIKMARIGDPKYGYENDDPSVMKALRDSVMNRPELAGVNAVKNGQVYVITCFGQTPASCIGIPYMAKAIYPDIFSDLEIHENHQQYLTKFQGLDFDVYEHGIFLYHPVYFPEGR